MNETSPDTVITIKYRVATFTRSFEDAVDEASLGGMFDDNPELADLYKVLFLADYAKMHRSEIDIEAEKMQLRLVDESVEKHLDNAPEIDRLARRDLEEKATQKKADFKVALLNKGLPEDRVQRFIAEFFNLVHITAFKLVGDEFDSTAVRGEVEVKKQQLEADYPEVFEALASTDLT